MPSIIPEADLNHILNVFEEVSEHPDMMDVDGQELPSLIARKEKLLVMIDDGIHTEITFLKLEGQAAKIISINVGMYTDIDLVTGSALYPEVRFEIYAESMHSLAWDEDAAIDEVVTQERIRGLLKISSRMKARVKDLFEDDSLL